MPYKDPEKQKKAKREYARCKRAKGSTQVEPYVEPESVEPYVEPKPANFGGPDCECRHCRANRNNETNLIINHGPYKPTDQLARNEVNRQSLPGDIDYCGKDKYSDDLEPNIRAG